MHIYRFLAVVSQLYWLKTFKFGKNVKMTNISLLEMAAFTNILRFTSYRIAIKIKQLAELMQQRKISILSFYKVTIL